MPCERPVDVLAHEGRGMVRACTERPDQLGGARRVAEADREIAQPPLVADAPDGRALQPLRELRLGPREELDERGAIEAVARAEILFRARLREAVPRAYELAVVAAVHAVADERAQLLGDRALVLDGEIGNAASRIELVGRADRARRAD